MVNFAALSVALQLATVFLLSASSSLLVWKVSFSSLFNLIWALLIPFVIGFSFNHGLRRTRMLILLPIASAIGIGFTANWIGYP